GKSAGLSGTINGMADSYWGRNKSRSMEGKLEKLTKYGAILWLILALVLNLKVF
ncbi:preprotein translocase subunit SecG, partial [Acinetobacter baumannii]|nr:preprotein translocase subunit SecG [Acinetobacter baumannii]